MPDVTITDDSAVLLRQLWEGFRDEHGDSRSEADLVDDAIRRVHRGFFGLPPGAGGLVQSTGPFRKWASERRAEVLLRQVDARTFRLAQPFRYDDGMRRFAVPEDDVTDLASVPRFLTWLVPRYGRHTLAALLHDHLQDDTEVSSERADLIFRDSMRDTAVPLSRRWLMWSAVAMRTEWNVGGLRAARAGVWGVAFGLVALVLWATVALLVLLGGWAGVLSAVATVGVAVVVPVALSWLFGRRWRLGAISGLALLFVTVPALLVLVALGSYLGLEWSVEHVMVARARRNPVLTRHMAPD